MPGVPVPIGRLARFFRIGPRVGIERLPALFWRQIAHRAAFGIYQFLDAAPDSYSISWAFLGADLAANTRGNLNRYQHHPRSTVHVAWYRRLALTFSGYCPLPGRARHIQAAHRA